jgi:hypothetical protein
MIKIEDFFGPGNGLRWADLNTPAKAAQLNELRPFLDAATGGRVSALPRVDEISGKLQWYVVWPKGERARFVTDALRAFVGPSFADLDGRRALSETDSIDRTVLAAFGANAIRIEVPSALRKPTREHLLQMIEVLNARPKRSAHRWRAVGRILRDFELALEQQDDRSAGELLDEIRSGGHLDGVNIVFLELRRHAAAARWNQVLSHPALNSVLQVGLPRRVAEGVARALYFEKLSPFVAALDVAGARACLRDVLLPNFGAALRTRRGLAGFEADAISVLIDSERPISAEDTAVLVERYAAGTKERQFLEAVTRERHPTPVHQQPAQTLDACIEALERGDVDAAFLLALAADPGVPRTRQLIRCALELDSDLDVAVALRAYDELSQEQQSEIRGFSGWQTRLQRLRDRVGSPAGPKPPEAIVSWRAWFARLLAPPPWPGALSCVELGARNWSIEDVARSETAITEIQEALGANLQDWAVEALRRATPLIVRDFIGETVDPRLVPILETLLDLLATDDAASVPLSNAVSQLAFACLAPGASRKRYADVLGVVAGTIERTGTPAVASVAIDALENVMLLGCPDEAARTAFASRVQGVLSQWWRRLDHADRAVASTLTSELGLPTLAQPVQEPEPDERATSSWAGLEGRTVAIYSLVESALARSKSAVEAACRGAEVLVFKDHVGGDPALKEAARTADLFVVVTGAAKHSATGFIEANRPKKRPTRFVNGKGSSAILAAIRDWLRGT